MSAVAESAAQYQEQQQHETSIEPPPSSSSSGGMASTAGVAETTCVVCLEVRRRRYCCCCCCRASTWSRAGSAPRPSWQRAVNCGAPCVERGSQTVCMACSFDGLFLHMRYTYTIYYTVCSTSAFYSLWQTLLATSSSSSKCAIRMDDFNDIGSGVQLQYI
jgi:hypothetical protein